MTTYERLHEVLSYDPDTGLFTWIVSLTNRIRVGDIAGSPGNHQYIQIQIDGVLHLAHRLAWLYMTGEWPKEEIDHKDRVRPNNKWDNLREATKSQNGTNISMRKDNTSGYRGVSFWSTKGKWKAEVRVNGRAIVTYHTTKEDAITSRKELEARYYGEFA